MCNICQDEINDQEFLFEATIVENKYFLGGQKINSQKQPYKSVVHICQGCYNKKIKQLLYGKEKK